LPVLKAAIRLRQNRSLITAATYTFMAQVSGSWPVEANFMPVIDTMFGASGNWASEYGPAGRRGSSPRRGFQRRLLGRVAETGHTDHPPPNPRGL